MRVCILIYVMNNSHENSNNNTTKRSRGRPRKVVSVIDAEESSSDRTAGIPGLFLPTEHDVRDELSYLDSYTYSQYNE